MFLYACVYLLIIVLVAANYLQYDVLTNHDLFQNWNRSFLEPEHGRYLATALSNLFIDILPRTFNIHPNDFQAAAGWVKGVIVGIICICAVQAYFLFQNSNIVKKAVFPLIGALVFLVIFSEHWSMKNWWTFLLIHENFLNIRHH